MAFSVQSAKLTLPFPSEARQILPMPVITAPVYSEFGALLGKPIIEAGFDSAAGSALFGRICDISKGVPEIEFVPGKGTVPTGRTPVPEIAVPSRAVAPMLEGAVIALVDIENEWAKAQDKVETVESPNMQLAHRNEIMLLIAIAISVELQTGAQMERKIASKVMTDTKQQKRAHIRCMSKDV